MTKANINNLEDGEITLKTLGMLLWGKTKKVNNSKFLFQVCDVERYRSSHYTNLLVRMSSCDKNNDKEKIEIRKIVNWYVEIRRLIHQATKVLIN